MTRSHQLLAAAAAALVLSAGYAAQAQDTPEPLLAVHRERHKGPAHLRAACRSGKAEGGGADIRDAGAECRLSGGNGHPDDPAGSDGEALEDGVPEQQRLGVYFVLAVTPQGTTVRRPRRRGVQPAWHLPELSHRGGQVRRRLRSVGMVCAAVPLTDEQIGTLQAADPRCAK